jgi:hypothetical protein
MEIVFKRRTYKIMKYSFVGMSGNSTHRYCCHLKIETGNPFNDFYNDNFEGEVICWDILN